MAEPLAAILQEAQARWMIGGAPAGPIPHRLTDGADGGEADLRLLAVAGQFRRLCLKPQAPELTTPAELPALPLPVLPEQLRPQARRLLARSKDAAWQGRIATLVASRGYLLHPVDWLPPLGADDLPEAYQPLRRWLAAAESTVEDLNAETWDDFGRADRRISFAALRRRDPDAACALLAERLSDCPADERVRLLELMAQGLTLRDAEFLEGLLQDRSEKVRDLSARYLARLGRAVAGGDETAEAAEMFEVASAGLLRRSQVVRLKKGLKKGQLQRLGVILPSVTLDGLARALNLTADEFARIWAADTAPPVTLADLAQVVAGTGSDAQVAAFWARTAETAAGSVETLATLAARMTAEARDLAVVSQIGAMGDNVVATVLSITGPSASETVARAILKTSAARDLPKLVRAAARTDPQKAGEAHRAEARLSRDLDAMGFLLTPETAAATADDMIQAGLHPADPKLDLLRFNAALKG